MLSLIKKIFGSKAERDYKEIQVTLEKTLQTYEEIKTLDNDQLRDKTRELKERIAGHVAEEQKQIDTLREFLETNYDLDIEEKEKIYNQIDKLDDLQNEKTEELLETLIPEAFSVIKETARRFKENDEVEVTANDYDRELAATRPSIEIRGGKAYYKNQWMAGGNLITWDMVHYDVQLIGGIHLHAGKIAEMATGEGKTLVATLPVYLNALPEKGVHIVTVNDYLAKRDSEWMGMLFEFHGMKVDCIDKHTPHSIERRAAYLADITYGTNNEFGFDYLRDNMSKNPGELVQRKLNYTIVDEVDSVLIDDARTPLIISGPTPQGEKHEFHEMKPKVEKLYNAQRMLVTNLLADARKLLIPKDDQPDEKKGGELLLRAHRGLPKNKALIKFLSEPGMKTILQKTENFYMQEQNKHMHIIDDDLFFVIEEKNNSIELTEKGIDLITSQTDDPGFFILPDIGSEIAELEKSGMSAEEKLDKKNELLRDFQIKSERVHTINQLLKAYTLFEKDTEYVIMDNKVKIVDEQTGRIMEGRRYSDGLHQAIEAKENVRIEAATQTYATITLQNYFRMYRKLAGMTGTAETEAGELWNIYKLDVVVIPTHRPVIRDDREDLIYKTKREKYNAIIEEIGNLVNAGRPVLVGTTSVETSELLSRMLKLRSISHNILNAKQHQKEAQVVKEAGQPGMVTIATNMAGRGTDIKLGPGVREAGGLAILGTERHESRRVDRQLRGRAGRQGDPGSSQFFVSLEDDLMRVFGSGRISSLMDRMGLKEGEVIQHSMITKSIERAQKKVEENNFGIRKRLLEYDDVMNAQREVIYKKRRNALFGERLAVDIANMMFDTCEQLIFDFQEQGDFEGFTFELLRTFGVEPPFGESEFLESKGEKLTDALYEKALDAYKRKNEQIAETAYPVIKEVYEKAAQKYENIAIPITDGMKTLNMVANLKKAYDTEGREVSLALEKGITLGIIDNSWKDHLREMDDLKQSVQGAAYEQKDPLLIYKFESFELFKKMLQKVNKDIISFLGKARLPVRDPAQIQRGTDQERMDMSKLQTGRSDLPGGRAGQEKAQPVRVEKKVGRNEPCPCGSGKKYKQCHGRAG
ncbi:MAG: preprotein translocase subunit SecA [Bacteroidia bacterium]|nr:MAG: preprotein translocase subunit SecA [Bacteroidia bacterium]